MNDITKKRICPDFEKLKNLGNGFDWSVKGAYGNAEERKSFYIEINTCMKSKNPNCKSQTEIDDLLSEVFFTFYHANGKAELKNFEDHAANPVSVVEEFHSQF